MKTVVLKVGDLAILRDGGPECEVVTGYQPGGPYAGRKVCGSLREAAVAFSDIFGLRVQRWAAKKEAERDGTSPQKA